MSQVAAALGVGVGETMDTARVLRGIAATEPLRLVLAGGPVPAFHSRRGMATMAGGSAAGGGSLGGSDGGSSLDGTGGGSDGGNSLGGSDGGSSLGVRVVVRHGEFVRGELAAAGFVWCAEGQGWVHSARYVALLVRAASVVCVCVCVCDTPRMLAITRLECLLEHRAGCTRRAMLPASCVPPRLCVCVCVCVTRLECLL